MVVTPEETDAIPANPGMGWQTFHRTRRQDKNLPAWIPSNVHYARWGWGQLEPQPGRIDYDFLRPVADVWAKLNSKLRGHYQYYGVNDNGPWLKKFRHVAVHLALRWLRWPEASSKQCRVTRDG